MQPEKPEDKVVSHLDMYRLSLGRIIQTTCFDGAPCADALRRMEEKGVIKTKTDQATGLKYIQVSVEEAQRRKININRTHELKSSELREALAVLWFCCMNGKTRSRVSRNKLGKAFGRGKGFGRPHCIEEEEGEVQIVYRTFVPGPNTKESDLLETIKFEIGEAIAHDELSGTISQGMFGFAILTEDNRVNKYRKAIVQMGPWVAPVLVEAVPELVSYSNLR